MLYQLLVVEGREHSVNQPTSRVLVSGGPEISDGSRHKLDHVLRFHDVDSSADLPGLDPMSKPKL